jgi:hypothetical protein
MSYFRNGKGVRLRATADLVCAAAPLRLGLAAARRLVFAGALSLLLAAGVAEAQTAQGQMPKALPGQPLIDEKGLTKVSEHVYALVGWPTWDED